MVVGIPDNDHVVVHLLQLLLGNLKGVRRGVELVGLEALIAEPDGEGLIIGLAGAPWSVTRQFASEAVRSAKTAQPQKQRCKCIKSSIGRGRESKLGSG